MGLEPEARYGEAPSPHESASAVLLAAFEEAADAMAVIEDGAVVRANRAWQRLLSTSHPQAEGITAGEAFAELVSAAGRNLEPGVYRIQLGTRESAPQTLECSISAFAFGERELRIVIAREIEHRLIYSGSFVEPPGSAAQFGEVERLEVLGRLAASVYHDFNNVLTAVLLHCGRLLAEIGPRHKMRNTVLEIYRAGQRGATLVSQLLAYAQPSEEPARPLDLNATLADLRELLQRLVGENIKVELACSPQLPLVRVDATQVERILMNLAANARDAMPEGGRLQLRTWHRADAGQQFPIVLEVSDTGSGMDPATQASAFQPFFTTKGRSHGTGLGLSIVQGLVEVAGGAVELESRPGEGTTVSLFFPVAEESAEGLVPIVRDREDKRERHGPPATIVLVEDDAAVRQSMGEALSALGHRVLEAASAEQALLLAAGNEKLDLLVSDLVLPGMGGQELASRLAARRAKLAVVLVSGYPERGAEASQAEGRRFLRKPFTQQELMDVVEQELERANRNKKQLSA